MTDLARPADAVQKNTLVAQRDVVFAFFGASWAFARSRGMIFSEDRLADELTGHEAVRRLLVCNPYRSVAGRMMGALGRRPNADFPEDAETFLYEPLRLRRTDPTDPSRSVARYEAKIRAAAQRRGLERPAMITGNPFLAGFGRFDWAGPVTYYAWDDWSASVPHSRWWPAIADAFAGIRANGRRVVSVTEAAERSIGPTGAHAVIANGVAPDDWRSPVPPAWFMELAAPRFVYAGSLDERIDVDQVVGIAKAFSAGSIVLAGSLLDEPHFEPLRELDNVHLVPWLPRTEITGVIAAADVCLVPHVRNSLTEAMSPLKVFEYLAAGRPVAAVDLPAIAQIDEPRLILAPVGGDLTAAAARALVLGPAGDPARLAFIEANSWTRRFEELLALALAD